MLKEILANSKVQQKNIRELKILCVSNLTYWVIVEDKTIWSKQ